MAKGRKPQMMDNRGRTKFWNIVEKKEGRAELTLYGEILPENPKNWWSDERVEGGIYVSLENFMKDLDTLKDCQHLTIRINSEGGDVFTAMTIRSRLEELPCEKEVIIDGLAASAASFIGLLSDTPVKMHKGAMFMIHQPSTFLVGGFTSDTLSQVQSSLVKIEEAMLDLYEAHSTTDREELRTLMYEEKWFTTDEALSFGLADEVIGTTPVELYFSEEEQALVSAGLRFSASGFKELPKTIKNKGRKKEMKRNKRNATKGTRGRGKATTKRRTRATGQRKVKAFGGTRAYKNVLEVLEEVAPEILEENPELASELEEAIMEAEPETTEELSEAYPKLVEEVEGEALPDTVEELEEVAPALVEEIREEEGIELVPETVEELEDVNPELVEEILEEGAEEERLRLEEIDEVSANITDRQMIHNAKYGAAHERMTASELSRKWLAKSSGSSYQKTRRKEYGASGAKNVRSRPNGGNATGTSDRSRSNAASELAKNINQK